jgi:hypothetical protein
VRATLDAAPIGFFRAFSRDRAARDSRLVSRTVRAIYLPPQIIYHHKRPQYFPNIRRGTRSGTSMHEKWLNIAILQ